MTEPALIPGDTDLERLVARSRMIGADPTLVVHGGGNTSSKIEESGLTVLRVKGSGTDLATIDPDGFPGLFLEQLLPLRERAAMTDEEMVAYLATCMVEPGSRRPSIETLLHAFLPATHVDHVHADAICALTNTPGGAGHVRAALGPDVAIVPYIRPGFDLSRQVADLSDARAVVLDHPGLVTWGNAHERSYRETVALVARAEAYLVEHTIPAQRTPVPDLPEDEISCVLALVDERLSRQGNRVLSVDRIQRALADRPDVEQVATAARATPDHILRIGAKSVVIRSAAEVIDAIDTFEAVYRAYFDRHRHQLPPEQEMLNPSPRVILVPGLGCIAAGTDERAAKVNAEIAFRSHTVTARALDAFGAVEWLDEADIFAFDYWPLELAKLAPTPVPA